MEEQHHQHYFYIIPAELAEQGDHLKALLFGLIVSLTDKKGTCWASNRFLAEKLGRKKPEWISKKLSELEKEGWILREVVKDKRKIKVAFNREGFLYKGRGLPLQRKGVSSTGEESNISEYNNNSNKFGDIRDLYPTVDQIMKEKTKDKKKE